MTLAEIISLARERLDDLVSPYLWSNELLTDHLNEVTEEVCSEIPIIEDDETADIAVYDVTEDEDEIDVSPLITRIRSARLSSQSIPLVTVTRTQLDEMSPAWRDSESGKPRYLVYDGEGNDVAMLSPPPDADDTLTLNIYRLPTGDLEWDTDQASEPEIPAIFHRKLVDGIVYLAYSKQDSDSFDARKEKIFAEKWKKRKEEMRWYLIKKRDRGAVASPHLGFI